MMKTLKHISAALMLALAALASGCAADEEMTTATPTHGEDGELMTITVSMGSDATTRIAYDDSKVSATENDALTWEAGDKIHVVGWDASSNYIGKEEYTLVGGAGQKTGSFTGKAIAGATKYNIAYFNAASNVSETGDISSQIGSQTQAGDGNTNHLKDNLFLLTPTADVTDLSNVQLEMTCAIMKFDLSNVPAGVGTLKKLIWTVEGDNGNQSMELAFSQNEGEKVTFSSSNQTLTAYLVFDPNDMKVKAGGKFIVMLEGDTGYYAETTVTNGKSYENGKRYTATIDGWRSASVVQTTILDDSYSYDGLEMQIGTWTPGSPSEYTTLGYGTITNGKAFVSMNLGTHYGEYCWVCIPKVAKFFRNSQLSGSDTALTLPDKDGGSTLDADFTAGDKEFKNDWIVALYMGVNKDGATGANAIPIYWATGNLIATKKNAADSGSTDAVFHIATADETRSEATTNYLPTGIASNTSDGYAACAIGAQWDKFGWGDATGLAVGVFSALDNITTSGESISGNATYDIARAKLGGSWRLPTRGSDTTNELAAFADNSVSGLSPDGMEWMESDTYTGRTYTYTAANNITNTLKFPAAGYRQGAHASEFSTKGLYWSGTLYSSHNGSEFHFSQGEAKWGYTNRSFGLSVRPVTE